MEPQTPTERMIREYVPGKQVTLAHLIANPAKICSKAGSAGRGLRHRHSYHYPQ